MPGPRLQKTLADYVGIAIGPVLIMLLVGSLVFFLAEVVSRGAAAGTLRWILFWYTFATVLISRIGIEQGKGYAAGYGLALAAATALVVTRLLDAYVWLALILLGVAWWATNKLVWDCTLIDERQDASGQGLLQASGLQGPDDPQEKAQPPEDREQTTPDSPPRSLWQRLAERLAKVPLEEGADEQSKPHAPGRWVIYFSLAALPLFGLGQLMIPAEAADRREYAFKLLAVYVAAALALLVTTSFLGLRRYLRQRKLTMPARVTSAWLITGGGLIVSIMLLCLLIPRPQAAYSLTHVVDKLATKLQQASQNAIVKGEAGEGEGKRIGERDEDIDKGQGGGNGGKDDEKGGGGGKKKPGGQGKGNAGQGAGEKRGKGKPGQRQNAGNNKQADRRAGRNDPSRNSSSPPSSPPAGSGIGETVKWIIYGLLALAAVFLFVKYREQIASGLRQFFADLRALFGRKRKPSARGEGEAAGEPGAFRPPPRPFAAFSNPFASGSASQMSTESVIAYTFEAMEAWAYERGVERRYEQTPIEFARELGEEAPGLAREAMQLARLYTRANYSDRKPGDRCRAALEQVWRGMAQQAFSTPASIPLDSAARDV